MIGVKIQPDSDIRKQKSPIDQGVNPQSVTVFVIFSEPFLIGKTWAKSAVAIRVKRKMRFIYFSIRWS